MRFLSSFGMTDSYVFREGFGGGFAAAKPFQPGEPPESRVIPNEERNLHNVYRTLLFS
jgi:hypothetical protein